MLLVWVASIAIGYVVEVARASERTLARALEIEAATRERERLARDIHDSVLQVLAMVQRRGTALGGEAAELGRMAGEQEVALRTLVSQRPGPTPPASRRTRRRAPLVRGDRTSPTSRRERRTPPSATCAPLLAPYAGRAGHLLRARAPRCCCAAAAATELAAAVGAALDNVRQPRGRRTPGPGSWSRTSRTR